MENTTSHEFHARFEEPTANSFLLALSVLPLAIFICLLLLYFPAIIITLELVLNLCVLLALLYERYCWDKDTLPALHLNNKTLIILSACGAWCSLCIARALLGLRLQSLPWKPFLISLGINIPIILLLAFLFARLPTSTTTTASAPQPTPTLAAAPSAPAPAAAPLSLTSLDDATPASSPQASTPSVSSSQAPTPPAPAVEKCHIVIADFPSLNAAQIALQSAPNAKMLTILLTKNQRYAITTGEIPIANAAYTLRDEIMAKRIPPTLYCLKKAAIIKFISVPTF